MTREQFLNYLALEFNNVELGFGDDLPFVVYCDEGILDVDFDALSVTLVDPLSDELSSVTICVDCISDFLTIPWFFHVLP